MSKAIRFDRTGGPEVLALQTVEVGDPGPGQARVRHTCIAVNYIDVYVRRGLYRMLEHRRYSREAAGNDKPGGHLSGTETTATPASRFGSGSRVRVHD